MINLSGSQRALFSQSSPAPGTDLQASSPEPIDCAALAPAIETLEAGFQRQIDGIVTVANDLNAGTADELDVIQKFNSLLAALKDAPDSLKVNVLAELAERTQRFLADDSGEPVAADASRAIKTAFTEFVRPQVAGANFPQPDIGGNEARKQGLIHWIDTQALPDAIPSSEWLNAASGANVQPDSGRNLAVGDLPNRGLVLLPFLHPRDLAVLQVTSKATNQLVTKRLEETRAEAKAEAEVSRDKNLVNKWIQLRKKVIEKGDELSVRGVGTAFIGGSVRDKFVGRTPAFYEAEDNAEAALVRLAGKLPELADIQSNLNWFGGSPDGSPPDLLQMPAAVQSVKDRYEEPYGQSVSTRELFDLYVRSELYDLAKRTRPPLPK